MKSHLIDKRTDSKLGVDLSHVVRLYDNSFKPSNKDIQTHNFLERLRSNKTDYIKGISDILSDSHKFKELTIDPPRDREGKL